MKKIETIFTEAKDVHLTKDVGQVINYLARNGRYQATLVTYKNECEYTQLKKEAAFVFIKFIKNYGKIFSIEPGIIMYLLENSKNIDVLNLYGNRISNLIYIFIYKHINKMGFSYIKMDDDIVEHIKIYKNNFNYRIKKYIYKKLSIFVDLYSVETYKSYELIKEKYIEYCNKIIYLPNCVNNKYIDEKIVLKRFKEKENIILVVGRIGAKQKNHELLLSAVKNLNLGSWKLVFIGKLEEDFKNYIDIYFKDNKNQLNNIIFKGEIRDRDELYEWYNRSKIFCLPSRYENFPLACVEALYFGNWIIATRMTCTDELLNGGAIGDLFEVGSANELNYFIKKAISKEFYTEEKQNLIHERALSYRWSERITKLQDILQG